MSITNISIQERIIADLGFKQWDYDTWTWKDENIIRIVQITENKQHLCPVLYNVVMMEMSLGNLEWDHNPDIRLLLKNRHVLIREWIGFSDEMKISLLLDESQGDDLCRGVDSLDEAWERIHLEFHGTPFTKRQIMKKCKEMLF